MWTPAKTGRPTIMLQLLPIENPRGMADGLGWLSRSLLVATVTVREFDSDPTDPECPHRQRSTYCHFMHHADDNGLLWPPACISADMPLAQKKAPQCAWPLPLLSAIPSTVSHTHSASASGVGLE